MQSVLLAVLGLQDCVVEGDRQWVLQGSCRGVGRQWLLVSLDKPWLLLAFEHFFELVVPHLRYPNEILHRRAVVDHRGAWTCIFSS